MSSEDTPRSIQSRAESDPKSQPPDQHQPDSDIKVDDSTKDYHEDPADAYTENPAEQPERRRSLTKIRNIVTRPSEFWIALFTAVLALFTAILAVETGISLRILSNTDEALHKTSEATDQIQKLTEENNRAWIGPGHAPPFFNNNDLVVGSPIIIAAPLNNVGHSNDKIIYIRL